MGAFTIATCSTVWLAGVTVAISTSPTRDGRDYRHLISATNLRITSNPLVVYGDQRLRREHVAARELANAGDEVAYRAGCVYRHVQSARAECVGVGSEEQHGNSHATSEVSALLARWLPHVVHDVIAPRHRSTPQGVLTAQIVSGLVQVVIVIVEVGHIHTRDHSA